MHVFYFFSVDCGPPISPINGNLEYYPDTKQGTNVTFSCNEGYIPTRAINATCNHYGLWDPTPEEHNCTLVEGNFVAEE